VKLVVEGGGVGQGERRDGFTSFAEGHVTAHAPSKVKLRELCKMSKGSKVVAISGQDLSSDSCPLALSRSLPNNTPYMNSNISVSRLTCVSCLTQLNMQPGNSAAHSSRHLSLLK
jgi:hypothetical protein